MAEGHTEEARDQKWSLTTFVHISAPPAETGQCPLWAGPGREWDRPIESTPGPVRDMEKEPDNHNPGS